MKSLATLGGGCFWCTEAVFQRLKGVTNVVSGFSGGNVPNPTYRQVCSGNTGHAEVIQFNYDDSQIQYRNIINIFLQTHDPTTLNYQGYDYGTEYRSVIFYHNDNQKTIAQSVIDEINERKIYKNKIVTQLSPFQEFYKADNDHQKFYDQNRQNRYCKIVIDPKIFDLESKFYDFLKKQQQYN